MKSSGTIRLEQLEWFLLLSFSVLFSFSLLYIFRIYDNNTLTSWRWVFAPVGIQKVLLFLIAAIFFSFLISRRLPFETFPVPVLIFFSTMAVLPLWSEPELLLDSGRYFLQAKALSQYGPLYFIREWGHAITIWTDMPLVPFLYGLIFKFVGETRVAVQFFNTLLFVLTVVLTCRIGTILWNRDTGFYAGFLLLGMPYLLTQVSLMLVDVQTMFFLILAVYCFIEALRCGGFFRIALASLTLVLAFLAKYSTWPMLAILPICGFIYLRTTPEAEKFVQRTLAIILAAALPVVVIWACKYSVFTEQLETLLTYQRPALKLWNEGFASTFFFQIHPFVSLLALYGGFRAYLAGDRRFLFPLLFIFLVVLLQIGRIRYMLPLFPFLALMAAYGLAGFKDVRIKRYAASVIVSSSLVVLLAGYLPFFKTTSMMNIQAAGAFLNQLDVETVEVYALPQQKSEGSTVIAVPQLDLFTNKTIVSRQDWAAEKSKGISPLSSMLATWKLNKPAFYQAGSRPSSLVIISGSPVQESAYIQLRGSTPPGNVKHFTRRSGVFRYTTYVSIYY